jgi:hypothetical protein
MLAFLFGHASPGDCHVLTLLKARQAVSPEHQAGNFQYMEKKEEERTFLEIRAAYSRHRCRLQLDLCFGFSPFSTPPFLSLGLCESQQTPFFDLFATQFRAFDHCYLLPQSPPSALEPDDIGESRPVAEAVIDVEETHVEALGSEITAVIKPAKMAR